MRTLAAFLLLVSPASAASVLLQTIEHTATFDAVPTIKQISFFTATNYFWTIPYEDSDLGVTTWSASESVIAALNGAAAGHSSSSLIISELPNRRLYTMPMPVPYNVDGTYSDGDSVIVGTMHNRTWADPPVATTVEMELSTFRPVGGRWEVTQTMRLYGPVPEPGGEWLAGVYAVGLWWVTGRRVECKHKPSKGSEQGITSTQASRNVEHHSRQSFCGACALAPTRR